MHVLESGQVILAETPQNWSTQWVLQIDVVTVSKLFSISKIFTSEHGHKIMISHKRKKSNIFKFFKNHLESSQRPLILNGVDI